MIEMLIMLLRKAPPKMRVFILQSYIQQNGPIPDERSGEVLALLGATE